MISFKSLVFSSEESFYFDVLHVTYGRLNFYFKIHFLDRNFIRGHRGCSLILNKDCSIGFLTDTAHITCENLWK